MSNTKYNKVLFTDLDGTLIKPIKGTNFPIACWDVKFIFETLDAIKKYKPDCVVIISNQGGIKMGYVNEKFFKNKIQWISSCVAEYCDCDCFYKYCPDFDIYNQNRKPNAGMIFEFMKENDNDSCSYQMIGDRIEDKLCAENAFIGFQYVDDFIKEIE